MRRLIVQKPSARPLFNCVHSVNADLPTAANAFIICAN